MKNRDRRPFAEFGWSGVALISVAVVLLGVAGLGELAGSQIDWNKFGAIDALIALVGVGAIVADRHIENA